MTGAPHREREQPRAVHRRWLSPCALVLSTSAALLTGGCFQPAEGLDESDPNATQAPAGSFGADGGLNSGCSGMDPSPLSSLHVKVLTSQWGGRYRPRNVGAIWIETAAGQFVKTIEKWAGSRARYLVKWNAASHGNTVDAITSATLNQHVTHDRTWDLTDQTGCEIPAGDYRVVMEHTDYDGAGAYATYPFTKGTAPVTLTPADSQYFHSVQIELK